MSKTWYDLGMGRIDQYGRIIVTIPIDKRREHNIKRGDLVGVKVQLP